MSMDSHPRTSVGRCIVNLRDYFQAIAAAYKRVTACAHRPQALLRRSNEELADLAPVVSRSLAAGKGVATFTPWVGLFNADETTDPLVGIDVVYLLSADLAGLTLTFHPRELLTARRAARGSLARLGVWSSDQ